MSSAAQIAPYRANAQHSTGPKADEGKAKSSANRLSHGFASNATIMPGEDPEEFKALLDSLIAEHHPATETEQILVEKMATHQWLSLRAFRLQGYAFVAQSLNDEKFAIPKELGLLIRYHETAERAFHRSHNELVKTRKQRQNSQSGFVPQNAADPASHTAPKRKNEPIAVEITWAGLERQAESSPPAAPDPPRASESIEFIRNAA